MDYKVSVVVPVYKAEKYIERCAKALFNQSLEEIEYIFVDDASPDRSIVILEKILKDYPYRAISTKIIRHKGNQGVSKSRQDGVDCATGRYIIHCDPDDWVETEMYEKMYVEAVQQQADIVICDFFRESKGKGIAVSQKTEKLSSISILESISGRSEISLHGSLCNKLIRSEIYSIVKFPNDINYCEDVVVLFQILKVTRRIGYVGIPLYHYNIDSEGSLVKTVTPDALKMDYRLIKVMQGMISVGQNSYNSCLRSMIISVIFNRAFLFSNMSSKEFRTYYADYIINFLNFNKVLGYKRKLLLWLSGKGYFKEAKIMMRIAKKLLR